MNRYETPTTQDAHESKKWLTTRMLFSILLVVSILTSAEAAIRKGSTKGTYSVDRPDLVRMLEANGMSADHVTNYPADPKRAGAFVLSAQQLNDFVTRKAATTPKPAVEPAPTSASKSSSKPGPTPAVVKSSQDTRAWLPTSADKGIRKGPSGHYVVTKTWLVTILGHTKGLEAKTAAQQEVILRARASMDQLYTSVDVLAAQIKAERDKADQREAENAFIIAELQKKNRELARGKTTNAVVFGLVGFGLGKATN